MSELLIVGAGTVGRATGRSTLERDTDELLELGRRARAFYLENHTAFVERLTNAVDELTGSS